MDKGNDDDDGSNLRGNKSLNFFEIKSRVITRTVHLGLLVVSTKRVKLAVVM